MGRLGSTKLDSTIACSIMLLCDMHTTDDGDSGGVRGKAGAGRASGSNSSGRTKRVKGACGTRGTKGVEGRTGVWTQKQLTSLVWALGHKNQDVLVYTAWTVYVNTHHSGRKYKAILNTHTRVEMYIIFSARMIQCLHIERGPGIINSSVFFRRLNVLVCIEECLGPMNTLVFL